MLDQDSQGILDQASRLPPEQQVQLVDALLQNIPVENDQKLDVMPEEVKAAWGREIQRRKADVDTGRVHMIPIEDAWPRIAGNNG